MKSLITLMIGAFLLSIPKDLNSTSILDPSKTIGWCEAKIKPNYKLIAVVEATMYHPVPGQTDDTPDIVADGTKFDIPTAGKLKWIAVSRDLHYRWGGTLHFGDIVYIETDNKAGFYLVKDTMNERFTKRIDFLESPGTDIYRYDRALLYLVWSETYSSDELWAFNFNHQIIEEPDEQRNSKNPSEASGEVRITL